jgi:uncharacterized protein (DUF1778 family)
MRNAKHHWKEAVAAKVTRDAKRTLKRMARAERKTLSRYVGTVLEHHATSTNGRIPHA